MSNKSKNVIFFSHQYLQVKNFDHEHQRRPIQLSLRTFLFRLQPDLYSQDSLESGSGGFDIQFSDSPQIPLGLVAVSPTDHLNDDSAEDEDTEAATRTDKGASDVDVESKHLETAETVEKKIEVIKTSSEETIQDKVVNELTSMVNEAVKDIAKEAEAESKEETSAGKAVEKQEVTAETSKETVESTKHRLLAESESKTGRRGNLSVSKPEEYKVATLRAKRRFSDVDLEKTMIQKKSEDVVVGTKEDKEKSAKVWMHIRSPKEPEADSGKVILDCSREFKKAFQEEEKREKKEKVDEVKAKKPGKGRPKGTPSDTGDDVTGRKRRELNRLKTDMVGAENIFDAVPSGDEDNGMQRRTRRGKRQRSPVETYQSDLDEGHKRTRSEHRDTSPGDHRALPKSFEKELKKKVTPLAKLAKGALPPGTNLKDIPKMEPPHKQKVKKKTRKSPWTVVTKRRGRGGCGAGAGRKSATSRDSLTPEKQDVDINSEEEEMTETETDISQEPIPALKPSPQRASPQKPSPAKPQQKQQSPKERSVEPEIAKLDTVMFERPPSKYHIPSPTRMKTRGKRTNILSMMQDDYLELSPEKELVPVKRSTPAVATSERKPEEPQVDDVSPAEEKECEMEEEDFSSRVISGTIDELEMYCKPCSVVAVDFIRCLDLEQIKKSPGSTSPASARGATSPRLSSPAFNVPGASSSATSINTSYHMDSSTEGEDEELQGQDQKPTVKDAKGKKVSSKEDEKKVSPSSKETQQVSEASLTPEKATSPYEAQFLNFLNKPDPTGFTPVNKPSTPEAKLVEPVKDAKKSKGTARKGLPKTQQAQETQTQPPSAAQETSSNRARYCCKVCTYSNNSRTTMQEHIYNHTSVVPYSCGYCSAIFGTKSGVVSHNKREHKNSPPSVIKTNEVTEEDYYYEQAPQVQKAAQAAGVKRKAESPALQPAQKRRPTARKSVVRPVLQSTSVVASLLQSPPIVARDADGAVTPTSGSLKMKFSLKADKKEAILMSGPNSASNDEAKKSVNKVTPRPRIPKIEQVDPNRPYYQCRHCTFATHNLAYVENHTNKEHSGDQRYVCPLCDLAYCKYEDGEFAFAGFNFSLAPANEVAGR